MITYLVYQNKHNRPYRQFVMQTDDKQHVTKEITNGGFFEYEIDVYHVGDGQEIIVDQFSGAEWIVLEHKGWL